ncbi:ROK family protein [Patescibacteria group bacterium]|nr:ROK family protein [Patescibacteria group bacterium]MBU3999783.1 ROK family protein [Patescibacteria group bacterium]MBU4056370.1 ROK family protein [Patescibacteria group bacterium]MBU4368730.1 ROK family protein [Patescibacteria group bacterium]
MKKQNIYLGIDIGATKTIFLVVKFGAGKFKILEMSRCFTPRKEADILKMAEENFKGLAEKYEIAGIGIGFAGPVDFKRGAAVAGPNLKTGKIEFKKYLSKKLQIPVTVDNDAKCFVLAENIFGAAKGYKNIIGITIGTGIGGGIIIDGKIYRGATGSAGEFGHTNISKDNEWEAIASGSGLVNIYQKISGSPRFAGGEAGKKLDSFIIIELAKEKNKNALKSVEKVAENLGIEIANIVEIFNPEIIVLGGGLSEVGLIVGKAKEYAKKKVFLPSLAKTPIIVSKLGQPAVALGAAYLARNINKKTGLA